MVGKGYLTAAGESIVRDESPADRSILEHGYCWLRKMGSKLCLMAVYNTKKDYGGRNVTFQHHKKYTLLCIWP